MARRGGFLRWFLTIAVLGAAGFLIWTKIITKETEVYENPLILVSVQKPRRENLDQSLELNGYIQAEAMIPVVPFVSGTIVEFNAKAGDEVSEGQVLARIDPKPYELQFQQAEAVYLAAQATFERVSNLYSAGAATQQNYDEAKAQVDAYKAQYELAQLQLDYATVTSPVSGNVLISDGAVGSIGTQTSPMFVIADLNDLIIKLNVPEKYFDLVMGNRSNIRAIVSRDGASVSANVDTVAPYISPESKTFEMTLSLEGDVSSFRPGMYVNISLIYDTLENVLVLDQKAKNTDGSMYYYDSEEGVARYVQPQILASNNDVFAIEEDYADYLFITEGQSSVLDGQKVNAR